jgi:NAD(P)-dependent dehydrogenase (short-subunit alcohol dehydrogenase family)
MSPVMIVTGGGRGIGAATVRLAAARGYSVLFSYGRDDASARRVVEETEASGQRVASVKADMGDESEIERLFALCDREFGRLDALINNAGIIGSRPEVIDIEGADLRRVLEVNVQGTFLACREAMRRMARSRGGRGGVIVNVSSRASQHGGAGVWVHYAAAHSLTYRVIEGADHALCGDDCRRAYTALLANWAMEMVFGSREEDMAREYIR